LERASPALPARAECRSPLNFVNPPRDARKLNVKSPTEVYPDVLHSEPNNPIEQGGASSGHYIGGEDIGLAAE
jgi:hypothetical protein